MIKNVSSAFKANCKKDSVKYREYIVIDNKEVDIKGNLSDTAYKDTTFFGKFNLKMLKFETENDIDYKKKEFTYYKEVDGEALKIGTFIVTDVSDSDTFESVNVTAYDYGLKFANPYKSTLNYSDGNVTLFQVIQEICTNCDVELENTSLPNGSFIVDSNQFVNGEQYGDVVAQASVINGMFATINSNDKLEFIFTNETNEIIEDYVELDDKRDTWPITSVLVATNEDLETAGAVKKDQSLIEQYGEHWLKIYSYGFAYSTIKCQQLVEAIFNQVKGFAYSSFKSEYSFLPYLSLGDKIKFKNKEGKLVDSVILRYETNYDEITLEAPSIISASVQYTLPETDEQKLDKVGIEVNQALKTIELLSEKIVDISAQASGHKEVELENCSATPLYKLKITGDDSLLFPGDKKKYFTYETYEGSSIDVDIKGSSYDINNLEVKGRSTQEVRSGYNFYKATKPSYNEAGLTITNNGDGTYIVNGTATSDLSTALNDDFMPVSGTFRIVGCPSGGSSSTYMLSAYVGYWGGASPNIDIGNGTNITYTGNFKLRLYIKKGTVCNNLLFKPMVTYDLTKNYNDFEQYGASPSPDYPSEIETVKGRNICDVSTSQIGVAWNLSTNSARAICNVRVMPSTTYSLSFEDISGIDGMFFGEKVKATNTNVINGMTQITANRQITTTSTTNWLCIQFNKANISLNDIEAIKLQIEKGSAITNYVPFDNIQIINTGKNLFDEDKAKKRDNYNISLSNNYKGIEISLKPNTKYSISRIVDSSLSADAGYNLQFVKEDKSTPFFYLNNSAYSQNVINGTTTFTTGNTGVIYLATLYGNDTRLSTYFSNVNVQLEEGETVTSYEQYQSQTLNIDLQGNELCSIGDTKDILDISVTGDTTVNKKIGKVVLDGSENWRIGTAPNQTNTTYFSCDSYDNIISAKTNKIMSDYFLYNNDLWLRDVEGIYFDIVNSNLIRIRISKDIVTTVEEFKTWLSTHNVTVIYELATPKTINLSSTNPLYLYDGINHLTNDNNADMVAKMVKSTMLLKTSELYINQGQSNEKIFNLKIPALRELNGVKDEYNLENTKATLTKRIGLNANLEEYILTKPQIIDLGEITIELNEGTNILTMPSFPNNYYEVTYLLKNEYTDTFANQAQVSSMINIASDEILIKSKTEILENGDELIASINTQSTGNVLINASRLAEINANKINFNSYDFNVTTQNMKISIGQGDNKKDIINSNGVLTNLIYNGYTRGSMITGTGDYIPLGRVGGGDTKDTQRNEMIFSFKLPQNFTIQSAKIYLSHAPINWNISGTSITGYSRNLELYKGQNIEKLKINYDVVNSIINTGGVTTDKIYDVLGTNGFSGNATTTVSTKSAELKDYIDADKDNYFIIKDSNETAYTTNNDIFGRTGGVFGYLEIIGYSQV